mmetsp:Transcript_3000/g.6356  ORF Transcript_3000/g.6356 Transcript_3000/m.6356 type:complete len:221 (+) Transcript_3000:1642-2304(+)
MPLRSVLYSTPSQCRKRSPRKPFVPGNGLFATTPNDSARIDGSPKLSILASRIISRTPNLTATKVFTTRRGPCTATRTGVWRFKFDRGICIKWPSLDWLPIGTTRARKRPRRRQANSKVSRPMPTSTLFNNGIGNNKEEPPSTMTNPTWTISGWEDPSQLRRMAYCLIRNSERNAFDPEPNASSPILTHSPRHSLTCLETLFLYFLNLEVRSCPFLLARA